MLKSLAMRIAGISFKVFVAPVAITMFMLAMAAVAQHGANQQSKALFRFDKETLPKSMAVAQAADLAVLAHVNLYRAVNWAANSQQADKVEASSKATMEFLRRAKEELGAIGRRWPSSDEDAARRKAAADALDKYAEAATNVLDMTASDAATAFVFLLAAEKPFEPSRSSSRRCVRCRRVRAKRWARPPREARIRRASYSCRCLAPRWFLLPA